MDYQSVVYATKIRTLRTSVAMRLVATQPHHQRHHQVAIITLAMNASNFVGERNSTIVVERQTILMVDLDVIIVDSKIVGYVMKTLNLHI